MGKDVVAILGGRGMLGTDLAAACAERGHTVRVYDLPEFDITRPAHIQKAAKTADAIINCAAYTDVDKAETHKRLAQQVNAEAMRHLGAIARERGIWVLHFSTDFVFDGALDRPYAETDIAEPLNEYGRSKLAGERLLDESGCAHCIVRLEWTYGTHGTNFVTKLVERARAGGALPVVDDQVGSPTATMVVARAACELLERKIEGVFHLASTGYVSRFGVAQFIVERLGLGVDLQSCSSSDYPAPAARPLNSRFDCGKIQAVLNHPIKPWQGPLEDFLRQL
jgi:dTDP-4-dehydrorhamnose reductase